VARAFVNVRAQQLSGTSFWACALVRVVRECAYVCNSSEAPGMALAAARPVHVHGFVCVCICVFACVLTCAAALRHQSSSMCACVLSYAFMCAATLKRQAWLHLLLGMHMCMRLCACAHMFEAGLGVCVYVCAAALWRQCVRTCVCVCMSRLKGLRMHSRNWCECQLTRAEDAFRDLVFMSRLKGQKMHLGIW